MDVAVFSEGYNENLGSEFLVAYDVVNPEEDATCEDVNEAAGFAFFKLLISSRASLYFLLLLSSSF